MGESAALHVLTGRAYSIAHFPEFAVTEFRKALQLDPKYPHAHSLLGYSILEFRGEEAYPEARLEFERELKFRPDDYNALLLLGISGVALRDFATAETALLHAKRLRPEESFAYLYLGETFSGTDRLQLAIDTLEKYIRLVPNARQKRRAMLAVRTISKVNVLAAPRAPRGSTKGPCELATLSRSEIPIRHTTHFRRAGSAFRW